MKRLLVFLPLLLLACAPKPEALVAALAKAAEILAEKRKELHK